jgi:hypothetical protein
MLTLAAAADEVPGGDAIFAHRGVAVLWGVVRGADEATTRVVLRIERLDRAAAPWPLVSVEALDPFTRDREWVALGRDLEATDVVTVTMPREGFLTRPARRVAFFRDVAALQGGRPELVVFYVSLPDTVPEFASTGDLEEHFRRVRARLRGS